MTALLHPPSPDLRDRYWRCAGTDTDLVVQCNGGRVYVDHVARVLRARLTIEQSVGSGEGTGELADSNPATAPLPPSAGPQPPGK